MQAHWRYELWRLILLALVAALLGGMTGFWHESIIFVLVGGIAWAYFKLYEYVKWIESDNNRNSPDDFHGVWGHLTHITHLKNTKSQRRKVQLSDALNRFNKVGKALPYGVIMLNQHRQMTRMNKPARQMLGLDRKRDKNQRPDNLIRDPGFIALIHAKEDGKIEIVSPDNPTRHLSIRKVKVQGNLFLLLIRDISERVHLNEIRKNFIANASHELRTPLTVISGYLEIMDEADDLPQEYRQSVHQSYKQARRMERLIEDLLTLSRLENTELKPDSGSSIPMGSVLETACEQARHLDLDNTHSIECDIAPDVNLFGKEKEIESVCNNLIANAVRHTKPGTCIQVSWQVVNAMPCLEVTDNGDGIPAVHIPRLTERFYRVDEGRSRDKGGTGLGLAIVKHIVQRHEGRLTIESKPREKTTFRVCFPARRLRQ